jgi:hypothetical protein
MRRAATTNAKLVEYALVLSALTALVVLGGGCVHALLAHFQLSTMNSLHVNTRANLAESGIQHGAAVFNNDVNHLQLGR